MCNECEAKWCPHSVGLLATTDATFTCDHGFLQVLIRVMAPGLDVAINKRVDMNEKQLYGMTG